MFLMSEICSYVEEDTYYDVIGAIHVRFTSPPKKKRVQSEPPKTVPLHPILIGKGRNHSISTIVVK